MRTSHSSGGQSVSGGDSRIGARLPRGMRRDQWAIGLVAQSAESVAREGLRSEIRWLPTRQSEFLADPFALPLADGRLLILAELLPYRTFQGELVAAVTTPDRFETAEFKPLLRLPGHLSYPQLVPWQGQWLLFCEAWEAGCLPVFAASDPQGPWKRVARLLPGLPAVDPTLVEHEGRWYLFVTSQSDGPNRRLRLYHGDTPLGPWLPHRRQIIVDDPSHARPAGPFFRLSDGTLVRSGQDCSRTYGGAVQLFRVDRLSPEDYAETFLRRIDPPAGSWGWGLHTLCPIDDKSCIVDGKRWLPAPLDLLRLPLRKGLAKLRRLRARAFEEQQPVLPDGGFMPSGPQSR
jgi:hypothetical protein